LVEAVFFTARVSLRLNRTDNLYENSATTIGASERRRLSAARRAILAGRGHRIARPIGRAVVEEKR
jgi:hypothetical protein